MLTNWFLLYNIQCTYFGFGYFTSTPPNPLNELANLERSGELTYLGK